MSVMNYGPIGWLFDEFPHVQRGNIRGQNRKENRRKTKRLVKRHDQRRGAAEIRSGLTEWDDSNR